MENISSSQMFALAGIILMILEVGVPGFVMLPMGVAFLITAAIVPLVPGTGAQLVVLFVSLVFTFLFFFKVIRPKVQKQRFMSNAEGLIGKTGTVEEEINPKANTGYVKIYGDSWKAVTLDSSIVAVGAQVTVESIQGNKIFVRKA